MPGSTQRIPDKRSKMGAANYSCRKAISPAAGASVQRNIKNEGDSGDVHENKGAGKCKRTNCQEAGLGSQNLNTATRKATVILNSVS